MSIQHKLDRVRPPRVNITYDVEVGDAKETKELAFVVGVMADLSGQRITGPDCCTHEPTCAVHQGLHDGGSVECNCPQKAGPSPRHLRRQLPKPLGKREFVDLNPDNFDDVLKSIQPRLKFNAKNMLAKDPENAPQLGVDLYFEKLEDFEPQNVVEKVEPLRKLKEARAKLKNLANELQGNEEAEDKLYRAIRDPETLKQLLGELSGEKTQINAETETVQEPQ